MAKCGWCKQEMSGPDGADECSTNVEVVYPDGTKMPSVKYDPNSEPRFQMPDRCHDCNVKAGGAHHPGCDMERCPKCSGQLISCGCLDEEDS